MSFKLYYIYFSFVLLFFSAIESYAQQDSLLKGTLITESYLEGPHIKFLSKSKFEVFYIQHDSLKNETKKIAKSFRFKKDSVIFKGFAGNDTLTYIIPKKISAESGTYPAADQIVVLGDIHGEFESLLALLRYNKIIDKNMQWSFGKGHVVFTGDVFDRGDKVTECLWLIFQLEIQAKKAGGKVHLLLGNHETMALLFDDRYVAKKYQHAARFVQFHYSHFFDKNSILGIWLRSKNTLIRIGDYLFVHGGISPDFLKRELKIDDVNVGMRYHLNNYTQLRDTSLIDLFLYADSPLWYRGYLSKTPDYERISLKEVNNTLRFYKAKVIIFGHTPVARIYPFYSFKLIAMDVPIGDPNYTDQALLIDNNTYYRIFSNKQKQLLQ